MYYVYRTVHPLIQDLLTINKQRDKEVIHDELVIHSLVNAGKKNYSPYMDRISKESWILLPRPLSNSSPHAFSG